MTGESNWRGDDEGGVRFGRRARAWLRRKAIAKLFCQARGENAGWLGGPDGYLWTPAQAAELGEWYASRWRDYVKWEDDSTWSGTRYANGHWAFDEKAVARDVQRALADVNRALDARDYPTLDEWLRADIDGKLNYKGDAGGMANVSPEMRRPRRRCLACGARFLPKNRKRVRCEDCCQKRRGRTESAEHRHTGDPR